MLCQVIYKCQCSCPYFNFFFLFSLSFPPSYSPAGLFLTLPPADSSELQRFPGCLSSSHWHQTRGSAPAFQLPSEPRWGWQEGRKETAWLAREIPPRHPPWPTSAGLTSECSFQLLGSILSCTHLLKESKLQGWLNMIWVDGQGEGSWGAPVGCPPATRIAHLSHVSWSNGQCCGGTEADLSRMITPHGLCSGSSLGSLDQHIHTHTFPLAYIEHKCVFLHSYWMWNCLKKLKTHKSS